MALIDWGERSEWGGSEQQSGAHVGQGGSDDSGGQGERVKRLWCGVDVTKGVAVMKVVMARVAGWKRGGVLVRDKEKGDQKGLQWLRRERWKKLWAMERRGKV